MLLESLQTWRGGGGMLYPQITLSCSLPPNTYGCCLGRNELRPRIPILSFPFLSNLLNAACHHCQQPAHTSPHDLVLDAPPLLSSAFLSHCCGKEWVSQSAPSFDGRLHACCVLCFQRDVHITVCVRKERCFGRTCVHVCACLLAHLS